MIGPILWIVAMLGLILATAIVALREKSARAKVVKSLAPQQPMDMNEGAISDGFDEADPVDSFGMDAQVDEFAAFDEEAK